MKRTELLHVAAAFALATAGAFANTDRTTGTSSGTSTPGGTHSGTSSSDKTATGTTSDRMDTGKTGTSSSDTVKAAEDSAKQARSAFVEKIDKQLDTVDDKVSSMKKDLDKKPKDSASYRQTAMQINAVQGKLKEARDNLKLVDDVPAGNWQDMQAALEKNVSELNTMVEKKAE